MGREKLPEPEELARKVFRTTGWMKSKKVVLHVAQGYEEHAETVKGLLQKALKELGLGDFEIDVRKAKDYPDDNQTLLHAWLGMKKMQENALHVSFGPFEGKDVFRGVEYDVNASAGIGGVLAIHPRILALSEEEIKKTLIHELAHLLGLTHDHAEHLPIMNPLEKRLDKRSREYLLALVRIYRRMHGLGD